MSKLSPKTEALGTCWQLGNRSCIPERPSIQVSLDHSALVVSKLPPNLVPLQDRAAPSVGRLVPHLKMDHHTADRFQEIPVEPLRSLKEVAGLGFAKDKCRQPFLVRNRPGAVLDPVD